MSIPTDHHHVPKVSNTSGGSVLTNRYLNRGTAFTMKQREDLHILARLPPTVETLEEQVERVWRQLCLYEKPINKYSHLAVVHATNTTLYYAVLLAHIEELLPVIYTPTVGEACIKFSRVFVRERGLYLNKFLKGRFEEVLRETKYHEVEIIVITDGSRILGLGDLGSNGVGISLGKCSLYIAGAGLHPMRVLPIVMDCGTNNKDFLEDKDYLGIRERRLDDEQFYGLMDEFMDATRKTWPTAVIQFEDFSNNHCFDVLERYQNKYRCFNDDIQGTGAVIAAGFLNAIKLSGLSPLQQRVVVFGAGSAAVGVARNIAQLASRIYGCSVEEVLKTFYLVDTKGLVTTTRGDTLAAHKVLFARTDVSEEDSKKLSTLEATVAFVKPTALLGLGGVGPVFTEAIVKQVAANCEHPIIFPLANPTSKSEVNTDDAYRWTNGKAIVAAGSPTPRPSWTARRSSLRRATTSTSSPASASAALSVSRPTSRTTSSSRPLPRSTRSPRRRSWPPASSTRRSMTSTTSPRTSPWMSFWMRSASALTRTRTCRASARRFWPW
ncbi:malic enzyme [Strigomonas culicis]|uniref:Malic enzyme n=1 Tax=Strigomonas culicis TaxID=28005 RepID=S9W7I1_9TRYP|nr:malic enzyme [Strigomonas culicis]|eukprot:EPY35176.1 malic enzyme [Strigomonas culicis]